MKISQENRELTKIKILEAGVALIIEKGSKKLRCVKSHTKQV
ncbi:MAG: hypothetical protein RBR12_05270 [Sulfurospirillum cavolei]|nr:hypothetical protein [Sulfurospirillum cavolei]